MTNRRHTARSIALLALRQVEEQSGYSNIVLDHALDGSGLSERDKALASAIFYGVLERRLTLDYYIAQCLRDPGKKLDPMAREALRCGAYQIFYLDRVPDSAAVNETVSGMKLAGKPQLSGFVNGVLRGLVRKKDALHLPEGDSVHALSLRYSVPEELIRLWQKSYGEPVVKELLESLLEKPKLYIRVNRTKCDAEHLTVELEREGVKLEALQSPNGAAVLTGCGAPQNLPQFQAGMFHVQDLSAQWVCRILDPQPGEIICDCCAAPGGKTFTIAQDVGGTGRVYALDLYESRVKLMEDGAKRLGLTSVTACVNDAVKGFEGMPPVDKMLCDVPCSGFGVVRRKPEIRYKKMEQMRELPELQYAILRSAAHAVKPGGLLVYSTCTLNPAENSEIAERFLRENNGFEPIHIETGIRRRIKEPEYMLTMLPSAGASDGFFAAAFRKKDRE